MPATDKSFAIKQNTPEADKLERRIHDELKEIWDPAADATVARYLTAMLAKGYERKKIHGQLKSILHEAVTVQLLDWLYKHLRLHGSEYQSKGAPASSKATAKPPPSAAKPPPIPEDELRLEDLEAQQLEGSDLDEDQPDSGVDRSGARSAPPVHAESETDFRERAPQRSQQAQGQPQTNRRAAAEPRGPVEDTTRQAVPPPQQASAREAAGHQPAAAEPSARPSRRQREPIPIPSFAEVPREKLQGADGAQPAAQGGRSAAAAPQEAQVADDNKQAAADRRRLKSSVVLDWETWNRQKQPGEGKRQARSPDRQLNGDGAVEPSQRRAAADRDDRPAPKKESVEAKKESVEAKKEAPAEMPAPAPAGRERAPLLVGRSSSGRLDPPQSGVSGAVGGDEPRGSRRDAERGASGSDRRRSRHGEDTTDLPESRQTGREDGSERRRHERDRERDRERERGGSDGGGNRRRGSSRERAARRSRSRSRSPRGDRRGGRPLAAPANLLRTALRGVDGMGGRPSVFARLGDGSARHAGEEGGARVARTSQGGGTDKDPEPSGALPGKKRGLDGTSDADADILGSPPKAARGAAADKPVSTSVPPSSGPAGPREEAVAPAQRTGPATNRQRVRSATPPADLGANGKGAKPGPSGKVTDAGDAAAGAKAKPDGVQSASAAPAAAADAQDPKAAELEALRRQMALMQEQLARMEAAKNQSQAQPSEPSKSAEQPQPQQQAQPPQSRSVLQRLERPSGPPPGGRFGSQGPPTGAGGLAAGPTGIIRPGASSRDGAGIGMPLVVPEDEDVVIEGGAGSPPDRRSPTPVELQLAGQQLLEAQLDAEMRSVVVGNVHFLANEEVLAAHFSVAGPVNKVTILRDNFTQQPTGMAVVEMATEAATQAAATLSGSLLMDLPIVVTLKAVLLLQGMGVGIVAPDLEAAAAGPRGPGALPGSRLNPAAAPFVPLGAGAGPGPGRPTLGPGRGPMGGRGPWPGRVPGGRGMVGRGAGRSNVWVRDSAAATRAPAAAGGGATASAAAAGPAT